jgi:hypothetical protein
MFLEWDEAKSQRNLRERGFGFDHAAAVFIGPTLERVDNRREYGEFAFRRLAVLVKTFYLLSTRTEATFTT